MTTVEETFIVEEVSEILVVDEPTEVFIEDQFEVFQVITGIAIAGPEGPEGPQGLPGQADEAQVISIVQGYEADTPRSYTWSSPGAVTVIDFDHPLAFNPNVIIVDSAGTVILVPVVLTPGHVHADIGTLMSVQVYLS